MGKKADHQAKQECRSLAMQESQHQQQERKLSKFLEG
jgi:hypothetical protein